LGSIEVPPPSGANRTASIDEGQKMSWCRYEPSLNEILTDPIVEAVMAADAVDPDELEAMLDRIARGLPRARVAAEEE
jgi:hypothetical protein